MRLLYATSITFPPYMGNRLQVLYMAKGFSEVLGKDFFLGAHRIDEPERFKISNLVHFRERKSYVLAVRYLQLARREGITHIFCREEKLLFFLTWYNKYFFRLPIIFIYEAHWILQDTPRWYLRMLRRVDKIIVLTRYLADGLRALGVPQEHFFVAPDGVDLAMFDIVLSREEARRQTQLPVDAKIVMYTGHLYRWKGVYNLADAAKHLPEYMLVFVGGAEEHVLEFKKATAELANVLVVGAKPHSDFPVYLKAADVLVLPNSGVEKISSLYTSPMKLFEYMSSKRPIVASDLLSIREVATPENSQLVVPDNSRALADGIREMFTDSKKAESIAAQAYKDVFNFTWSERVKFIIGFIEAE